MKNFIIFSQKTDKKRFSQIYNLKYWNSENTSGEGSMPKNAIPYLKYLQNFIDIKRPKIIVDIGCGNFELMKNIKIPKSTLYHGIDIVDSVIIENKCKYSQGNIVFHTVNAISDWQKYSGDLLIIKDLLQHLNNEAILFFKTNILKNFKYAIIVNDFSLKNTDIENADYRPLNLTEQPFFIELEEIADYKAGNSVKRIYLYCNKNARGK
jgi:hypothetical protein